MNVEKAKQAMQTAMDITKKHLKEFEGGFPKTASEDNWYHKSEGNFDWTEGFYTGIQWLSYEMSGDSAFKGAAEEQVKSFYDRAVNKVNVENHDMGFLYTLSCVAAYKLTGSETAKAAALMAADFLKARFREKGQFIQAWGKLDAPDNYRLIIDCLLNLPLLYWASETTGDNSYRDIAQRHLNTTRANIMRDDFSTYHTFYFDLETGAPDHGATHQGYRDDSAWSRGQAWGVYGLMLNYAYTHDDSILPQWKGVTDYFIAHLPKDLAAYWDFYFMDGDEPRDSSASAIAVCGILEAYRQGKCDDSYLNKAYDILDSLIDNYAAKDDGSTNGILLHSTYGRLLGAGIDECCLWGDYFYMEALMRVINPDWKMYW